MRARARTASLWGGRLTAAGNILALVLLAAVYAFRSAISWRRWQRRRWVR